ncbi:hypothetical protein CUU64_18690 [Bacillus sp. V5-8f]|nr:hypothetical protein CUU64_18690 [Bacillus sp. V5-8f]
MINLILEHKWEILFYTEIMGWILTIFLLFARYYFQSKIAFLMSIILIFIVDYIPSIVLPVLDFFYTDNLQLWVKDGGFLFSLTAVLLFIVGGTIGKRYVKIIDDKILNIVNKRRTKNYPS